MQISSKAWYSREELLKIIYSWQRMIEKNAEDYPTACLDDLKCSIDYVLAKEGVVDDNE